MGKIVWILFGILYSSSIQSGGKEYKYKTEPNWSRNQKEIRQEKKIYVTCRLKYQKIYKKRLACIYEWRFRKFKATDEKQMKNFIYITITIWTCSFFGGFFFGWYKINFNIFRRFKKNETKWESIKTNNLSNWLLYFERKTKT